MRLANLTWAWAVTAAVGVVSVLAVGKVRQQREERHLNYDIFPRVPSNSEHSTVSVGRNLLISHEMDVHPGSISSMDPHGIFRPRPSVNSWNVHHTGRQRADILASNRKYSTAGSNKKKVDRRKNNRKNIYNSYADESSRGHLRHSHSLINMSKHVPVAQPETISIGHSSLQDIAGTQNDIYVTSRKRTNSRNRPEARSYDTSAPAAASAAVSSVVPFSRKQTKPLRSPDPPYSRRYSSSGTPSPSPRRRNTLARTSTKNSVDKYPYSTTFQSFDSFLKTMGTSLRLASDPHAIRTRSEVGIHNSGQTAQTHDETGSMHDETGSMHDETGSMHSMNDEPSSQDYLYENNALGIDVFEHDKATFLSMPERCCGSKVPLDMDNARPIGGFSRVAAAGSIKVVEVPAKDEDLLPPSGIRDLRSTVTDAHTIVMSWTTPGDDLDYGIVSRYVVRLSDTRYDLRERRFDQASSYTELDLHDLLEASGVFRKAGTRVQVTIDMNENVPTPIKPGQQYYLAIRALDDHNNTSPVSNVATFTLPEIPTTTTTTTSTTTTTTTTTTPPPTTTTTTPPPTTTTTPPPTTTTTSSTTTTTPIRAYEEKQTTIEVNEEIANTLTAPVDTDNERENQIVPIVTMEGMVVPDSREKETHRRKKGRKGKGRGRKNKQKKGKKGKRSKKRKEQSLSYDPYKQGTPGCHGDNGEKVMDGKLCDAISALMTVVEYFEQTRDYKHVDYLSAIIVNLRHRAQPHWRHQ